MSSNIELNSETLPALAEMGIKRFHEISHYSLRQDGDRRDVLRVNYKRAKGSWLPYSRKYQFGRALKTVVADGGTSRMESTYEISPFLLKAVVELEKLVEHNKFQNAGMVESSELKADLLNEVGELEAMVASDAVSADAVAEKFKNVVKLVEAVA